MVVLNCHCNGGIGSTKKYYELKSRQSLNYLGSNLSIRRPLIVYIYRIQSSRDEVVRVWRELCFDLR